MTIRSPKSYDEILSLTTRMYITRNDVPNYESTLPSYDPSNPDTLFPNPASSYFNVTHAAGSYNTLIGTYNNGSYRNYLYKSVYLTDNSNNVIAVFRLDNTQSIRSKALSFRITITHTDAGSGEFVANLYSAAVVSNTNRIHRPASGNIITTKEEAFEKNVGQPVYRDLQIDGQNSYFNVFPGLPWMRANGFLDFSITHVLPFYVHGIPCIEIRTEGGFKFVCDLETRVLWCNANLTSDFFLESYTTQLLGSPTWRYGFIHNGGDFLLDDSWTPIITGSNKEGVPFLGVGRDVDLVIVGQNQEAVIGIDFTTASNYLGEDVTGDNIERYLTPKYSLFYNSTKTRLLVVEIETQRVFYYSLNNSLPNELYYTEGNIIFLADYRCGSDWELIEGGEIYAYTWIDPDYARTNVKKGKNNIFLKFFNQKYLIRNNGLTINNIL